jgi:hypothetical protein
VVCHSSEGKEGRGCPTAVRVGRMAHHPSCVRPTADGACATAIRITVMAVARASNTKSFTGGSSLVVSVRRDRTTKQSSRGCVVRSLPPLPHCRPKGRPAAWRRP